MENLQVIIAEKLQLTRLGISGIIIQARFPLTLREISDPEKIRPSMFKEGIQILITSKSFLGLCRSETLKLLRDKRANYRLIMINDKPNEDLTLNYDELIEYNDTERTIFHKIESLLHKISRPQIENHDADISHREREVLKLVALGLTNREIAEKLFISSHTVITHRKNITSKLGIKTIAGLTVYAVINKLISAEELK